MGTPEDGEGQADPMAVQAQMEAQVQQLAGEMAPQMAEEMIEARRLEADVAKMQGEQQLKRDIAGEDRVSREKIEGAKIDLQREQKNLDRGLPPDYTLERQEAEVRELAEAILTLAAEMRAESQQRGAEHNELLQVLAAPRRAIRDASGRIIAAEIAMSPGTETLQ